MKADIQQRINITKETIKTSMDSFVMDSLTKTYNETFLREYLINLINMFMLENKKINICLIVLHIDNITKINFKYSNEIGDQTIINLGYLIRQLKSEDDLIFKSKGPGFILLIHNYKKVNIKKYVTYFQTEVRKAKVFLEPISISAAVIKLDDINETLDTKQIVTMFLAKATQRINLTYELPDSAYVDKDSITNYSSLGKILIAESDPLARKISKRYFEKNQYLVTAANDGDNAVKILENEIFDAIIVDQYTYKIDGITVKQLLNESTINMNTLYILTVQNKDVKIIEQANHVGINFVISKPIIFGEILGIIERNIKKRKNFI